MNVILKALLFISFIFLFGCKKGPYSAHFHGRITFQCDGRPVKGLHVIIHQVSPHLESGVGSAITDGDGYFSFQDDVTIDRSYDYFTLDTFGQIDDTIPPIPQGGELAHSGSHSEDVELNAEIKAVQQVQFHLVNSIPFDNNDNFILIKQLDQIHSIYLYTNLIGVVDTVLLFSGIESSPFTYEYQFVKNDDTLSIRDSIFISSCYTIPVIDILY